jgi:hypothetical protein
VGEQVKHAKGLSQEAQNGERHRQRCERATCCCSEQLNLPACVCVETRWGSGLLHSIATAGCAPLGDPKVKR